MALAEIVMGLPDGQGIGICWWGTEYRAVPGHNLATFNRRSFFGADGNVLPVATAFGKMTAPVTLSTERLEDTLVLRWPLSGAGMQIGTTTSLLAALPWQPLAAPAPYTNFSFTATAPLDALPLRLHRLQLP